MNANTRIAVNSGIIFIKLCVTSLVSLIASRLVLDALGASDYGLYNVVGGIVVILNVVNSAMLSTTYRYIAYEIGRGEEGNANKIFNTSFLIHVCFAVFILIMGFTVGEWYVNNHLNVESGRLADARTVFHISILTTALSTMLVPYSGLLVAYEQFAFSAIVEIIAQCLKLAAIVFILRNVEERLTVYAIIMTGYTVFTYSSCVIYCLKKYWSTVKFKIYKDVKLCKEMLSFALWTLFGAVANVGRTQGSAVILNLFYGTVVNAAFAIANQVNNVITTFARTVDNAAIPQITKSFSGGDYDRSLKLTSYISKYTFFLMLIIAYPVMMEMDFILSLWLKEPPAGTSTFCCLILLTALLDCMGEGIPVLVNATGNIRKYQIIFHTFTILGLPVSYVLYKMGLGCYTISIVFCVVMGLSAILRLYLLKSIYHIDISIFIKTSYSRMFYVSVPLTIVFLLYDSSGFGIAGHVLGIIGSEIVLLMCIAFLGLEKMEINKIRQSAARLIAKRRNGLCR